MDRLLAVLSESFSAVENNGDGVYWFGTIFRQTRCASKHSGVIFLLPIRFCIVLYLHNIARWHLSPNII